MIQRAHRDRSSWQLPSDAFRGDHHLARRIVDTEQVRYYRAPACRLRSNYVRREVLVGGRHSRAADVDNDRAALAVAVKLETIGAGVAATAGGFIGAGGDAPSRDYG